MLKIYLSLSSNSRARVRKAYKSVDLSVKMLRPEAVGGLALGVVTRISVDEWRTGAVEWADLRVLVEGLLRRGWLRGWKARIARLYAEEGENERG